MRRRAYVAVAILAVLAVGACSHNSSGDSAGGGKAAAALAPDAQRGELSAIGASTAGGSKSVHSPVLQNATAPLDDGTYKIRTAEMTVAVKGWRNVAVRAESAISIVEGTGGEVVSDYRTSGQHATATMRLRVPPDALQTTLSALAKLGIEKSREVSATDVTAKVVDVNSRVISARESIARLRALYAHATKVADVIAIEGELSGREANLESLEAQQRSLSRQTSMATVTLALITAAKHVAVVKPAKKRGGFLGGLERGWDGFTDAAAWVALAVGTLLPFLALLLVLAFAGRVFWTRMPHRPAPAPTPSE
jgi:hypothetical protein